MNRLFSVGLIVVAAFFAGASGASAQFVEQSRNVYHIRTCAGPDVQGFARCHAHIVTDSRGNPYRRNEVADTAGAVVSNVVPSGFGPSDLRSAYNVTGSGSSATIVAVVDAYGYKNAEADLAVYRSTYGLPACTTANGCFKKVNQNGVQGSYPRQNTGWEQETALDLDMVSAMCPNCKIVLVLATNSSLANLATAENTAAALGAHVISNSYGGGESGSQTYESAYNHPGVAITVSSGDSGYGVQFPAASPHVTAVGGTSLFHTAGGARAWSESTWSGAGSGCSTVYAKPAWQTDPLCSKRMEADVSAVADPATGVAVYGPASGSTTAWLVFGGTSVAAPLVGGLYGVNGGPVVYGSDPYSHVSSLNDVASGSNGSCGGLYFCIASSPTVTNGNGGTTYDGPTGLGTPNGVLPF